MADGAGRLERAVRVVRVAYAHDVHHPAATLAYYLFVSLLPLLVLSVAAISDPLAVQIQAATPRVLAPGVRNLIYESETVATERTGAVVFAVAVLLWSAFNVVDGFEAVVRRVEGQSRGGVGVRLRNAVAVVGSLALTLVASVLTSAAVVAMPPVRPLVVGGGVAALFLALTLALLPLYYVPSDVVTSLRAALPGAVTAALGWTGMLLVVHLYAVNAGRFALYGVLSGVVILLTALYVAAVVLALGVVVNAVVAGEAADPT